MWTKWCYSEERSKEIPTNPQYDPFSTTTDGGPCCYSSQADCLASFIHPMLKEFHYIYTSSIYPGFRRRPTDRPHDNRATILEPQNLWQARSRAGSRGTANELMDWNENKCHKNDTNKKNIWKIYRQKFYNHNGHIDHHWAIESPTWRTASRILIINNNNSNENEPMYPELKVFMDQNRPDAISPPAMATNPRSTHSFQVTQYQKCPVAAARTG